MGLSWKHDAAASQRRLLEYSGSAGVREGKQEDTSFLTIYFLSSVFTVQEMTAFGQKVII